MKLLTKNTDYAIRALLALSEKGGLFLSASTISKEEKIPYQYLRRILRRLIGAGLVVSREGSGGGFELKKDPRQITVADVMRVFQGEIRLAECMFRKKICGNRATCALRREINRVGGMVESEFGKVTLPRLARAAG